MLRCTLAMLLGLLSLASSYLNAPHLTSTTYLPTPRGAAGFAPPRLGAPLMQEQRETPMERAARERGVAVL